MPYVLCPLQRLMNAVKSGDVEAVRTLLSGPTSGWLVAGFINMRSKVRETFAFLLSEAFP
jgi:hypothetical protein